MSETPGPLRGELTLMQALAAHAEERPPQTERLIGGRRLAQPECVASVSGHCLAMTQSERPCDTDARECVYGGLPATPDGQDEDA